MDGLYNTDILTLAATIEHLGQLQAPQGRARKVSKLCGSWVEVDVNMDGEIVSNFAIRLQACALGQASASILSKNVVGATFTELETARDDLKAMLKDGAPAPQGRFAELVKLKDVANYPARHTSTLLAFEAVLAAIAVAKSP